MNLELNTLYNMDCMEGMKDIPDGYFNIALIDPKYGIGEDGKSNHSRGGNVVQKNGTKTRVQATKYNVKNWDSAPPDQLFFNEVFRVAKKHIIFGENYFDFTQKKSSSGRIVWDKVNGNNDQSDAEIAWTNLFSSTRIIPFMWAGMRQGSTEDGRKMQGNKKLNEKRIHPTQKPVQLYRKLLYEYALLGWKILDTGTGSGSSIIACDELGFEYMGFENDFDYYRDSQIRIRQYKQLYKQKLPLKL